jgi:hypothetical protein
MAEAWLRHGLFVVYESLGFLLCQSGSQACFSFHSTAIFKQKALDLLYVYSEGGKVTTLMEMI